MQRSKRKIVEEVQTTESSQQTPFSNCIIVLLYYYFSLFNCFCCCFVARPAGSSPTRLTRQQEKDALTGLDKRLELYVLKQREKDAREGTLQSELRDMKVYIKN